MSFADEVSVIEQIRNAALAPASDLLIPQTTSAGTRNALESTWKPNLSVTWQQPLTWQSTRVSAASKQPIILRNNRIGLP